MSNKILQEIGNDKLPCYLCVDIILFGNIGLKSNFRQKHPHVSLSMAACFELRDKLHLNQLALEFLSLHDGLQLVSCLHCYTSDNLFTPQNFRKKYKFHVNVNNVSINILIIVPFLCKDKTMLSNR